MPGRPQQPGLAQAQSNPHWGWGLGLGLLLLLRLVWIDLDPLLVSPSGLYLTDEGWYSKAGRHLALLAQVDGARDFVPITHTFGYSWLCVALFAAFGVGLLPLRLLSAGATIGAIAFLSGKVKQRWGAWPGILVGLGLSGNLLVFSLSRLAIPDTLAFAILIIIFALLISPPRSAMTESITGLLSAVLALIKLSYLPVSLWCAALLAYPHLVARPRSTTGLARGLVLFLAPLLVIALCYAFIHTSYPEAWAMFSNLNLRDRMVDGPIQWILNIGYAIGADLWSTGALALAWFALQDRGRREESLLRDPVAQALLALVGLNLCARSLIWYHPPRYGLVTLLCVLLLSVRVLVRNSDEEGRPSLRAWLLCLAIGQLPLIATLGIHGYSKDSMQRASQKIHHAIEASNLPNKMIYGSGTASWLALLYPELRAVDISDHPPTMCERIENFGEGFLIIDQRKQKDFQLKKNLESCRPALTLEPLWQGTVLNNYYKQGPIRLFQITRAAPGAAHPSLD